MMDWLSRPLPDFWGGISLVILGVILFVWGTASVAAGYRDCGRPKLARWRPRRWIAPCFAWWLGGTLIGVASIVGYIGVATLTDDSEAVPLWGMGLCLGTVGCALMAFRYWAIERLPERGL